MSFFHGFAWSRHRHDPVAGHKGDVAVLAFALTALKETDRDKPDAHDPGGRRTANRGGVIREDVAFRVNPFAKTLLAGTNDDMRFARRPGWNRTAKALLDGEFGAPQISDPAHYRIRPRC